VKGMIASVVECKSLCIVQEFMLKVGAGRVSSVDVGLENSLDVMIEAGC
jgi:hypothetical protein